MSYICASLGQILMVVGREVDTEKISIVEGYCAPLKLEVGRSRSWEGR